MRDTEELELGAFNLALTHLGHRQAAERNLFASGGVDTFHVTFAEELGEPVHAELRTDPGSRLGKSAASAVVKQGSARPALGGGAGAAVSRGPSLLTRVLGGSKNWKVPAGSATN